MKTIVMASRSSKEIEHEMEGGLWKGLIPEPQTLDPIPLNPPYPKPYTPKPLYP